MKSFCVALSALALCVSAAAASPQLAVVGVAANDTLALRAAPDAKSAKVGTLPPDAKGIVVMAVDPKGADWVRIKKGNVSGWANARFLEYEIGAPVKMTCVGTEPFWSMTVGYGTARLEFNGDKSSFAVDEPFTPAARPTPWLYQVKGKPGFLLVGKPDDKCSDGMSDNTYPYSMLVRASGVFAEGCCK